MTGSDWRSYEYLYYTADWSGLAEYRKEQLFYVLMIIGKYVIPDFFVFLLICKLLVFYSFLRFFKAFSVNIFYSYFFFIPFFALFLFIDNPLRYMIALSFLIESYKYLIGKKFFPFLFLVIAGALFHITILVFIPFYFIRRILVPLHWLAVLYLVWMFLFTTRNLLFVVQLTAGIIPFIGHRFVNYIKEAQEMDKLFSVGLIMNIVLFFWVLSNKQLIERKIQHGKTFFALSIIYLFTVKLGVIFPTGFRFGYMFGPFFIVVITLLFQNYRRNLKMAFSWSIGLYIFFLTFKKVDSAYVYLPYSNYLVHAATGRLRTFEERFSYNIDYFIERKGHHPHSPQLEVEIIKPNE